MTTENPRPRPPAMSPTILVITLSRRVEAALSAGLAPLDLTVARLGLLGHINGLPGASFSELARMSGTSVQSVHTAVKSLVAAGLVQDRTARAGSASAIELTEAGTRLLGEARKVVTRVDTELFGPDADPIQRRVGAAVVAAFTGASTA
ncbi:MarR family transcriptional regulator [Nocardia sp. MH4]|uniref:MarR family winged helix-turn-helix transcriptional regulator n=1 Tax=Nocardia TaxID=1817 RepID=UPI0027E35E4E|nr:MULTISPECIES: MarR family winged helix-turn-helix transcriptional regulator [Nocardia]MBW0272406.1 MarR family transcriptional regulator [Nocardia sp. MH4]